MKISVAMAFNESTEPAFIKAAVQLVEAKGVHGLWVPEHVLFFPEYASTYPYSDDGRLPGDPEGLLDPFTSLTFAAAHLALAARYRHCYPPASAGLYRQVVADLDYLSGGRADFARHWLAEGRISNLGMDTVASHGRVPAGHESPVVR